MSHWENDQRTTHRNPSQARASVLASDLQVDGNVSSKGEVWVHATVNGNIAGPSVVIEQDAVVHGDVAADSVEVGGQVAGDVTASEVTILATARLTGKVTYGRVTIAAGGSVEGELRRKKPAAAVPQPSGSASE